MSHVTDRCSQPSMQITKVLSRNHVPRDIWFQVAQFLPDTILNDLFALNSAFFNVYMDSRYRSIQFSGVETDQILNRLRGNAMTSNRVRSLSVRLSFELDAEKLDSALRLLEEVTLGLKNVTNLDVYHHHHPIRVLKPFLEASWTTFGPNLRSLSLLVEICAFCEIPFLQRMDSVFDLALGFVRSIPGSSRAESLILRDVIAPFVNRLAPKLQKLLLASAGIEGPFVDLSDFFLDLDPLPNLTEGDVDFPTMNITNTTGLCRMFHDHVSNHRRVRWTLLIPYPHHGPIDSISGSSECELEFNNLTTIMFTPIALGFHEPITELLQKSGDELTGITLSDFDLTYDQVATVMCILSRFLPNTILSKMSLAVQSVTPGLLEFLAKNFPGLKHLVLTCSERHFDVHIMLDPEFLDEELAQLREMLESEKASFANWTQLTHATVCVPGRESIADRMNDLFAEYIPAFKRLSTSSN